MFFTNSISISALIVVLTLQSVSTKKCIYVQIGDGYDSRYVECRNVSSMNELSSEIESNWNRLKIVNDIGVVLTIAGPFLLVITEEIKETIFHGKIF